MKQQPAKKKRDLAAEAFAEGMRLPKTMRLKTSRASLSPPR